jgi:TRAP-type mannitol/chloroaromatic compound transport system substrate-binding protein
MNDRRKFLKTAGLAGAGAVGASALAAPYVKAQEPIRWRLQTYAGAALGEYVIKPSIDAFNAAANGEMEIELYFADQLVPQGELFRAVQSGTLDAAQSDDDSMGSPADVAIFGAYFPFATRYSLDVPALFHNYGLAEIWQEAYADTGVTWLGSGAWDPCNLGTTEPIESLADLQGKRVFTFPTAGRFLTRFGVVPVTLPWEDIEVAMQTGELDGVWWCGATEIHSVGWSNVMRYYLTNNINGAWIGSYFANSERWNELPDHLKTLFQLSMDSSHYYRQHWYWWGEAHYRTGGGKLELTTIPEEEWRTVQNEAQAFWDEIAAEGERKARVVQILKDYSAIMDRAGPPYRYA